MPVLEAIQRIQQAGLSVTGGFIIGSDGETPEVFEELISEGHALGNHTFNHLNGWKTDIDDYVSNCDEFEEILHFVLNDKSTITNQQSQINNLFRPPFGKLTSGQSKILQKKGYKIIMWDILSGDFDNQITKEKCL